MNSRGTFLGTVALAAAAVESASMRNATAAATSTFTLPFDRAEFDRRLRAQFKHRQAFATPRVADGAVFAYMNNSLNAYRDGFGEGPGTLHVAGVFYGLGVAAALDDAAWKGYRIAQTLRDAGDHISSTATDVNPFVHGPAGRSIAELQQRHASFFVCNNALNEFAKRLNVPIETLYGHVLPGILTVPAGVATVNALQEANFTLFQASM